jgi:hypothetical protein
MKIFIWSIYPTRRVVKIHKLLGGSKEDIEVARELLLPSKIENEQEEYPQYRVRFTANRMYLESKFSKYSIWDSRENSWYDSTNKGIVEQQLKKNLSRYKKEDEERKRKEKFQEYTIKL